MRLIHYVSKNLILNQGCSQKCYNNENIHVHNNKRVHHQEIFKIPSVLFNILFMFSIDWFTILGNRILVMLCLVGNIHTSALECSIIKRYTNAVYYYYIIIFINKF